MRAAIHDLSTIGAGFGEPVMASQAVFRHSISALSRPGGIVTVTSDAQAPMGVEPAANALLLALLDQDTRLWLSPALANGSAGAYLRFHTGCSLASEPATADFALTASAVELPPLQTFMQGSDERPDHSATLVLQVEALSASEGWHMTGPGIKGSARLAARGLGSEFIAQWASNRKRFPRGVDLFLACGSALCALPRTTRIEA